MFVALVRSCLELGLRTSCGANQGPLVFVVKWVAVVASRRKE